MSTIAYYTATGSDIALFAQAAHRLSASTGGHRVFARSKGQLSDPLSAQAFAEAAAKSDAIVLSLHGGTSSFPAWDELTAVLDQRRSRGESLPWIHIQPSSRDDDSLLAAKNLTDGLEDGTWAGVLALLDANGLDNICTALSIIADRASGGHMPIPEPISMAMQGIHHPRFGTFSSLADYQEHLLADRPTIAILYPRSFWVNRNTDHISTLIDELERQGANALPIFCYRLHDTRHGNIGLNEVLDTFCFDHGTRIADAVINVYSMSVSMSDSLAAQAYPDLDVPIVHAMTSMVPYEQWMASKQGLATPDVAIQAAQPEFDGCLITKMIACQEADEVDDLTGARMPRLVPIPDRICAMASLAINWAKLSRTPNSEKRVAIVFHHNPPRNDRIGCATGLDSFESVRRLLKRMAADGYRVPQLFDSSDELAQILLSGLTCDGRWLSDEQMYQRAEAHADIESSTHWHAKLPDQVQKAMDEAWGPHPGKLFVYGNQLSFAGHLDGNVLLSIQPPRGQFELVDSESLHDETLPPPHHYLAHYTWIREVFEADAIIHVGTHGSLEWLPGKALGMSNACYPELALEDLPNIYPYIVNNPGEGIQAKRRSACALVSHLTPTMTSAGLYDETADLERALQEFDRAATNGPDTAQASFDQLWQSAEASSIAADLEISREQAAGQPKRFASLLHHYLLELEDRQIADGLHVLGSLVSNGTGEDSSLPPNKVRDRIVGYLIQLTRLPHDCVPSLREAVLNSWGTTIDECSQSPAEPLRGQTSTGRQLIERSDQVSAEMLGNLWDLFCITHPDALPDDLPVDVTDPASRTDRASNTDEIASQSLDDPVPAVAEVLTWVHDELLPDLLGVKDEIESIMHALDGGFVLPSPSGAPTRGHPEVLPTGRNFYSLDPRTLPTRTSWAEGQVLADQLLSRYAEQHPNAPYPQTVGIIIWGVSAMRTGGADIAEVLALYGLRPCWQSNGVVKDLEVIPLSQLGRPRIDVSPRISGLFRDAFPNLVELMDRAARIAAALDEPHDRNRLRAHVQTDARLMVEQGMDRDQAEQKAALRVFGCPPGTYGAGVSELIETKHWTNREDLGNAYIQSSSHAYGEGIYGEKEIEAFTSQLARMDATVKNEDTREYDMLSCTDFCNYYGGLIAAATTVRGSAPMSFIGDSSDPSRIVTRTTAEEARRILRSRILNPTWIEGLQRHGYKGAGDLSKVLDIAIGWDATSDVIDDHLWDRVARRYALDPAMQQWFAQVNIHALHNIVDKLLDAAQRRIWNADQSTVDELEQLYDDIEGSIEGLSDDADPVGGRQDPARPSPGAPRNLADGIVPMLGAW